MTTDPYAGMTPNDAARARQAGLEGARIQKARERAARRLLAPPGPAKEVRLAFGPITRKGDGAIPDPPDYTHTIGHGIAYDADTTPYVTPSAGLPGSGVALDTDNTPHLTDGD